MRRRYTPLGVNIWGSNKFRALQNDTHRLGYIYLLSSDHTTPIGVFRLPPSYAAEDQDIDPDAVEVMIADLERCGMIQTAPDHWIRIRRWFFEETGPWSPLNVTGFCKQFLGRAVERSGHLRAYGFAEMMAATEQRTVSWDQGTPAYNKMLKALVECAATLSQVAFGDLTQAMANYGPVPDGGVTHVVLDQVSRTVKRPVLETTSTLALSTFEGASKGHQSPIETHTLTLKHTQTRTQTPTRTLTQAPPPKQNTCDLVKYPTTIDEHLAALNAKKGA